MARYTLQYSRPNDTRIAVSEWLEHETVITGANRQAAIKKWQTTLEGTALLLDCYENKGGE